MKTHAYRMFRVTGTNGQAALVDWAWRHGFLGDRHDLLDEIARLRNQVEILTEMYRTAVRGA